MYSYLTIDDLPQEIVEMIDADDDVREGFVNGLYHVAVQIRDGEYAALRMNYLDGSIEGGRPITKGLTIHEVWALVS